MGKKSSTSGDDLANTKKHKKSEVATALVPCSKSLKNGKSVLEPCSTRKENLMKQISEENDEDEKTTLKNKIETMSKTIEELTETVKRQEETIKTMAKGKYEDYCNYECKEAEEKHDLSIIVKGLEKDKGSRRDIKKMLGDFFGSCGKIKSIFVPIACQTGGSLGYAFITFEDHKEGNEKALKKNGEFLNGKQLEVKLAIDSKELHDYPGNVGCKRCHNRIFGKSEFYGAFPSSSSRRRCSRLVTS